MPRQDQPSRGLQSRRVRTRRTRRTCRTCRSPVVVGEIARVKDGLPVHREDKRLKKTQSRVGEVVGVVPVALGAKCKTLDHSRMLRRSLGRCHCAELLCFSFVPLYVLGVIAPRLQPVPLVGVQGKELRVQLFQSSSQRGVYREEEAVVNRILWFKRLEPQAGCTLSRFPGLLTCVAQLDVQALHQVVQLLGPDGGRWQGAVFGRLAIKLHLQFCN